MRTRTSTLAAVAAALAASAVARWHQGDAKASAPTVQIERSLVLPRDTNSQGAYLPGSFVEEERAARIEPMPPQF